MSLSDDEFDMNDDAMSNIDEEEVISSDIEDNDDEETKNRDNDDDDDVDADADADAEEKEEEFVVQRKKLHQVKTASDTTDNTIIIVKPENRITSDHMTSYEYTHTVGVRATHISNGAPIYTNPENLSDPIEIAKKEIRENCCPLSIKRKLGNSNRVEVWSVNEMVKPLI